MIVCLLLRLSLSLTHTLSLFLSLSLSPSLSLPLTLCRLRPLLILSPLLSNKPMFWRVRLGVRTGVEGKPQLAKDIVGRVMTKVRQRDPVSVKRDLLSVDRDLVSVEREPLSVKRNLFTLKLTHVWLTHTCTFAS